MTNVDVDGWMAKYDNPQKPLVQSVREAILAADPRVSECIKWQAPTFTYKGNIASFFPKAKQHVSLMFHKGATIPGSFSILEGDAAEGRTVKVVDAVDLEAKRAELSGIIRAWCDMQDSK
jgi:uncharacterized protein YdhG (YjbR/CyaY superfamily)